MTAHVAVSRGTPSFRGFLALTGLFLCGYLAFGVGAYSFTQFLEPLAAEFHWGRTTLGGLMSAFWLSAPFALASASLLDRLGVRALIVIGGIIETAGLACMVMASKAGEFYLLRFCMGVGKVLIVTPLPVMAAKWFPRRPGVAIAVVLCGWHVGGLIMAPLSEELIAAHGWRAALLTLSAVMAIGIGLAATLLRDPTNHAPGHQIGEKVQRAEEESFVIDGAILQSSLSAVAAISLGTVAFYAGYAGLLAQLSPLLADCGFSPRAVGELTGSVAICAAVSVLIAGGVTQYIRPKLSGAAVLILMGLTAVGATTLGPNVSEWRPIAVTILLGALVGGGDPIIIDALRRAVRPHYFGRAYGWWYLLCLTALTIAPFAVGAAFDRFGSYALAFTTVGGAAFIAAITWALTVR